MPYSILILLNSSHLSASCRGRKMLMLEPAPAATFRSSARLLSNSAACFIPRGSCRIRAKRVNVIQAAAKEQSGSGSGQVKPNAKPQRYHPFEEIAESAFLENGNAALTPAETTRTIIEVNSKATLMFSGVVSEDVHENIFWPDLPYVTDEHGNIYFQVKNDEDILQTLTSEETVVQVIIGLDTAEILSEVESLGHSEIDFGIDELDDEDSDFDDDEEDEDEDEDGDGDDEGTYEKDWVTILDEDEQKGESDGSLGDWAKLETMRSSHPMYFAKKLTEVVSDDPVDIMEQPSAGLAIQGLLRPAFFEEHSVIQKQVPGPESLDVDANHIANRQFEEGVVQINGQQHDKDVAQENTGWSEDLEKDENLGNGFAFYKLEMIKIQLVSALGHQSYVEIEDFRRAQPDAIAHSASKIISRLKAGGEKTIQALKSLCWRCKGIQVEECALIGIDSLGLDVRVCSGIQVQTLRFTFKKKASSEYSGERQLNDVLFPRTHKYQQMKEARQTEP